MLKNYLMNKDRGNTMTWNSKNSIFFEWSVEDVKQQLKDRNKKEKLSIEDCREVLDLCLKNHDAQYGMNWDTMNIYIDQVLESNK